MMVPPGSGSLEPHIPSQISQLSVGSENPLSNIDSEPLIGDATTYSPSSLKTSLCTSAQALVHFREGESIC